jgi:hypothetical protein
MGGSGSGERWRKRRTVESCPHIDVGTLRRWKLLTPGVSERGLLRWRGGESGAAVAYHVEVGPADGTLRLVYRAGTPTAEYDYAVKLEPTPCRLGGVRWWFVCPLSRNGAACGRRVTKLYLSGRLFGCRHCHALTYRSQQTSDSRAYALARAGLRAMPQAGHRASVTQLGVALKALTIMEKRAARLIRTSRL